MDHLLSEDANFFLDLWKSRRLKCPLRSEGFGCITKASFADPGTRLSWNFKKKPDKKEGETLKVYVNDEKMQSEKQRPFIIER